MDDEVRQFPGQLVVITIEAVGDDQVRPVGSKSAAFLQIMGKARILFRTVAGPGMHDAQAVALDLRRMEAGSSQKGAAQRVDRVRYDADLAAEAGLAGQGRIMGDEAAVGFELGHAHVAAGADRRYALAGTENEDITVEDVFFRDDGHGRQDRVVTAIQAGKGVAYLVHLHFQAGQVLLVDIAHADRTDDVLAGQEQADEHGRAHISQGDDMDAGLPGQLRCPVEGHGRGSDFSGQIMYPFIQVFHLLPPSAGG